MKEVVVTVLPKDPVKKVIKELVDNCSSVAVKDTNDNLVGLVTEYDLILSLSTVGHGLDVEHIMKKDFISVKMEATVEEIADIFLTKRIKTLTVVDTNSKLVVILSRLDILAELYAAL